jgi:hypothetical protein
MAFSRNSYTFRAFGEFVLADLGDLVIQVRLTPSSENSTYVSAVRLFFSYFK